MIDGKEIDREVMSVLREYGALDFDEIAEKVDVGKEEVADSIIRLSSDGEIYRPEGYQKFVPKEYHPHDVLQALDR